MKVTPATLLQAVADVAHVAGEVALKRYLTRLPVEFTEDGSPVTDADRDAERAAREWIERYFPSDAIEGEEYGESRPGTRRRWYIDPVDSTRSFISGVPLWGAMCAVVEGEQVLAGALCFPALGEAVAAAPGEGCWWNGERCRVSEIGQLSRARVLTTDERFKEVPEAREGWLLLSARAGMCRTWGDCYGYLLVATGRAEAMLDARLTFIDTAPLQPIVVEAGGVFTDWAGEETVFGSSAIATNKALATEVRRLLAGDGKKR